MAYKVASFIFLFIRAQAFCIHTTTNVPSHACLKGVQAQMTCPGAGLFRLVPAMIFILSASPFSHVKVLITS